MKRFVKAMAGTLVATMFLTACAGGGGGAATGNGGGGTPAGGGGGGGTPAGGGGGTDTVATIRVAWWGSDGRHNAMQQVIDLYMEQNPGVNIEVEYGAWSGWATNILTQLSGGIEPDVMQVNYAWVHSFGRGQNVFYDLNQLSHILELEHWSDTMLETMTLGGELGAVPHGLTARVNVYNRALFERYGLEFPRSYAEALAAAEIIAANNTPTGAENQFVLTSIGRESTDLLIATMLYNQTGRLMQENGVINYTVEEVAEVFRIFRAFEEAGVIPNFHQEDPIQNESNPVWTSGRSGSVFEWVGTVDKYAETFMGGGYEHMLGASPMFTETGEPSMMFVRPSLGYAVSRNSNHPEIAADFINFMFTNEEAIMILDSQLGISTHAISAAIQQREGVIVDAMLEGLALMESSHQVPMDPFFEDENVRGERLIVIEALRTGMDIDEAAEAFLNNQQEALNRIFN